MHEVKMYIYIYICMTHRLVNLEAFLKGLVDPPS